jgi:hypothetical protein
MRLLMPEHDLISMWQTRNMGSPGFEYSCVTIIHWMSATYGVSPMKTQVVLLASLALTSLAAGETQAAENAAGIYLLGTKTSMAGFVPPPGTYFVDVNYFYSGDASGNAAVGVALRRLGNRLFPNLPLERSLSKLM